MIDPLLAGLLAFLVWWAVLFVVYCAVIFTMDAMITSWQQRQADRRALQARLDQIDADAAASVHRLSVAFVTAQRAIRETARSQDARQH